MSYPKTKVKVRFNEEIYQRALEKERKDDYIWRCVHWMVCPNCGSDMAHTQSPPEEKRITNGKLETTEYAICKKMCGYFYYYD